MPKRQGEHRLHTLKAIAVPKKSPGRHADGGGLYLEVDPSGARRWTLRTVVRGRRRDIGLGSAQVVSLAEARTEAARLRKVARTGGDPFAERQRSSAPDFETAARQCFEERSEAWRNPKHQAQWLSSLEAYVFPLIGRLRVDQIGTPEVLKILTPIWLEKPETARRVRQRVGLVLEWSKAKGFRNVPSPTREIGRALPAQKDKPRHHPALPYADVSNFIRNMRETDAANTTKDALEFLILTATRTNETLGAMWSEVDWNSAAWVIPGERMKSGRPHTVPLTERAITILEKRKTAHSGISDFVFESKPGKPLSNMALLMLMRRMQVGAVPHGFRSSFRDWAEECTNTPREVAEACLAHIVGDKTERAYKRTELLVKRRKLLDLWAKHSLGTHAVLQFKRVAGN